MTEPLNAQLVVEDEDTLYHILSRIEGAIHDSRADSERLVRILLGDGEDKVGLVNEHRLLKARVERLENILKAALAIISIPLGWILTQTLSEAFQHHPPVK